MTFLKKLLAGIFGVSIFATGLHAQIVREEHIDPPISSPADPKNLPPQSPAAPTSPGAIVIQYKLELLDKDGDGKVSRAEAAGVPDLLKIFDKLDRNGDGMLDAGELAEHNKGSLGAK